MKIASKLYSLAELVKESPDWHFNIPIYQRMQLTAVPKTLRNFGAQGLASFRPERIGYVKS